MLGFDYELRRRGFAGNSCQIILELSVPINPSALEARVSDLSRQHPIIRSRPARRLRPQWKPTRFIPRVRVHTGAGLRQQLFNEPLQIRRGELMRFDLIERTLIFTWAHALMDANSAEYFLALVGNRDLPFPEAGEDWYAQRAKSAGGFRQARGSLARLDQFGRALPVSLATVRPPVVSSIDGSSQPHFGHLSGGPSDFAALGRAPPRSSRGRPWSLVPDPWPLLLDAMA